MYIRMEPGRGAVGAGLNRAAAAAAREPPESCDAAWPSRKRSLAQPRKAARWPGGGRMDRTVAEDLWEMLASAGVRRCYGIVGDALNPRRARSRSRA